MDERPVQRQAQFADFTRCLGGPCLGGCVTPGRQGRNRSFHQAELTLGRSLERPEVARLQTVTLQLDASTCNLEGVFVELAANVADQPEAQERLQQGHTRTRFGPKLLLGQGARTALDFYTLAIDRADESVAHLYDPAHPAVLRLVAETIAECRRQGKGVSVCGEMAGDVVFTRLLLGLGLRSFSMHPSQILAVKQEVIRADTSKLEAGAREVLEMENPAAALVR